MRASGTLSGSGAALEIRNGDVTLVGPAVIRQTWLQVRADNVIVRDVAVRAGDPAGMSVDADAINLNGASTVLLDHVEAVWGMDVGGVTILNDSDNVTVQHSIVGGGLLRSRHPESGEDADGHSHSLNIAGQGSGVPDCVTLYRNLITTSAGRNPQVQGATGVDVVNNVIYCAAESPLGNPQGLNLANNIYREGPCPETAGVREEHWPWRTRASGDHPRVYAASVYLSANVADGYAFEPPNAPAAALRSTPAHPFSVAPETTDGLLVRVLTEAGPRPRDTITQRWLGEAMTRTGAYYSGASGPAPHPE